MTKEKIGFIGTGVMGRSMAGHMLRAGHPVYVYTRTKEKADDLLAQGAVWVHSPKEMAGLVDVVITMVGYPADVQAIYFGDEGLIANGRPGLVLIDMTTSTPTLAVEINQAAKIRGIDTLDAPVSGGDVGAKQAKLTIMVGGDKAVYHKTLPIFEKMGSNCTYLGEAGSGQHTKMANQIAIAGTMIGICEAFVYAEKAGLEPEAVLATISAGAASSWSMVNYMPRIFAGDFAPGFYIKHFVKDMTIALDEAEKLGMITPGLSTVKKMYDELVERGESESGTQALYKYWD